MADLNASDLGTTSAALHAAKSRISSALFETRSGLINHFFTYNSIQHHYLLKGSASTWINGDVMDRMTSVEIADFVKHYGYSNDLVSDKIEDRSGCIRYLAEIGKGLNHANE